MEYYNDHDTYNNPDSNTNGGFLPDNSQNTQSKKKPSQTLRPVTIKQLIQSMNPDSDSHVFVLDGVDLVQSTFVAVLRSFRISAPSIICQFEDGTGSIEVRIVQYSQNNEFNHDESERLLEITKNWIIGTYMRVCGHLKHFNNKKYIVANSIKPIVISNEITHHFLECIRIHLRLTKTEQHGFVNSGNNTNSQNRNNLSNEQRFINKTWQVIAYSEGSNEVTGVSLDIILSNLVDASITQQRVNETLKWLYQEGHIYETTANSYKASKNAPPFQ